MTGLYHIGLATTSSIDINEVLHLIYEQVNRVLHPDTFYIALYDEDVVELQYDIFIERGQALQPFKQMLDNSGISGWVISNRNPIFIRFWDVEIEQLPFEASVVGIATQSVITVPLIAKNKIVGVMSVQALEPEAFDQNHLRLLTSIAGQAALALENARLHATVNEQALRDALTGVFHHGSFLSKLQTALKQAHADQQTVALIMMDIDKFKQYNDTYGHLVGDDVLRSAVVAIQNHLKGTDVVGRWGGEEFGIVLSGREPHQARLIADRITRTLAHNPVSDLHGRSIPRPPSVRASPCTPKTLPISKNSSTKPTPPSSTPRTLAATRSPSGSKSTRKPASQPADRTFRCVRVLAHHLPFLIMISMAPPAGPCARPVTGRLPIEPLTCPSHN